MTAAHVMCWAVGNGGGARFSRSVNPISNVGADYAPYITIDPRIFRPLYGPTSTTVPSWAKQRGTVEEDLLLQIWAMQKT